jgi:hypothetical protein
MLLTVHSFSDDRHVNAGAALEALLKVWECCDREEYLNINKTTLNAVVHGCFAARAVKGPGSETSPLQENYPVTSRTLQV